MIRVTRATQAFLCFCVLVSLGTGRSQSQSSQENSDEKAGRHPKPCLFDFERGEVPDCVYVTADGSRFVASRYLEQLAFDANGLAGVRVTDGWMYVNRCGKAVITGVPTFDNGPDYFRDGLVRFAKGGKYGFADRNGRIAIPPIYDGAMPFERGHAKVCTGCQEKCADPECEYHVFSGGAWMSIGKSGATVK